MPAAVRLTAAVCAAVAVLVLPAGAQALSVAARTTLLSRQLTSILSKSGTQVGALVQEVSSGQVLYSRGATVARPPASVEKLYTTVAAVNALGASARFQTSVYGTGELEPGGLWKGDLYLRGGGDPTFGDGTWNRNYEGGHGPTATQLATQIRAYGIRRVSGHIYADESLFDSVRGGPLTDDQPDISDYGGELSALVYDHGMSTATLNPAVYAAHELAITLAGVGVTVHTAPKDAVTPSDATLIAHVMSPPLSVLTRLMDVPSDDLFADMLVKQLGARFLGAGTLANGAIEVRRTISTDYGIQTLTYDGSGLDRADRTTPQDVVSLLRKLWATPTGNVLYASLPVVGEQGTVASFGLGSPAQGRCVAKTGSLNDVTNLAGYCRPRGGPVLAFTLMIDGPPNYLSYTVLSHAVAAVARY